MVLMLHIAWNKMDNQSICIRLDNAEENRQYRMILDRGQIAEINEDGLYVFSGIKENRVYEIRCEQNNGEEWMPACSPVKVNFIAGNMERAKPSTTVKYHAGGASLEQGFIRSAVRTFSLGNENIKRRASYYVDKI